MKKTLHVAYTLKGDNDNIHWGTIEDPENPHPDAEDGTAEYEVYGDLIHIAVEKAFGKEVRGYTAGPDKDKFDLRGLQMQLDQRKPKVTFQEWKCIVSKAKYGNNRTALQLVEASSGDLVAVATVNIPEEELGEDEVFIKSWSENEGMAQCLAEAKIIGPCLAHVLTGFTHATKHKLLI